MKRNWQFEKYGSMILCAAIAVVIASGKALGNNSWLNPSDRPCLQFEAHKPSFEEIVSGIDYSGLSVLMTAYVNVASSTRFVVEIPIQNASYKPYGRSGGNADVVESETAIGNPYIGISWSKTGSSAIYEFGARPPIMGDKNQLASEIGLLTLPDRMEAFIPKTYSLHLLTGYRYESSEQVILRFLAGPTVFKQDAEGAKAEVFIDHRIEVWADLKRFYFGGAYAGRFLATNDIDFSDRFTGQIMLAAGPKFGSMQAGLNLIIPMDDFVSSIINVVYGVNFTHFFPIR